MRRPRVPALVLAGVILAAIALSACGTTKESAGNGSSGGLEGGGAVASGSGGGSGGQEGLDAGLPVVEHLYSATIYNPSSVHVDSTYVYWPEQGNAIMRAPKSGGGTPERIGDWGGLASTSIFASDDQYVYWALETAVRRFNRDTRAIDDLPLPDRTATMKRRGDRFFFSIPGCGVVGWMNVDGTGSVTVSVPDALDLGGGTLLAPAEGGVFCGSYQRLFFVADDRTVLNVSVEQEHIGGMTVAPGGWLYWQDATEQTRGPKNIKRWREGSSQPEVFHTGQVGVSASLLFDESRSTLYWPSAVSLSARIVALAVESRQERVLAEDREVRNGFDMDAEYVYWSETGQTESAIVRAPK